MSDHTPNSDPPEGRSASPPTRPMRWLKYGTNVAVLVLATAAIVVMVNWLGYDNYYRFDFTQTRQYSLSEQTVQLLDQLEADVEITSLYADGTAEPELFQRVRDLLGEYSRRSRRVTVRQIDPIVHHERFARFTGTLRERFADEVEANHAALNEAPAAFARIRQFADRETSELSEILPLLGPQTQELALILPELNRAFMRLDDELREYERELERALADELPDFAAARELAAEPLDDLANGLDVALERFQVALDDPNTPDAVEDALLGMRGRYRELSRSLRDVRRSLRDAASPGYDKLRTAIGQTNSLVVAMDAEAAADRDDRGLVVLTLEQMYPNLHLAQHYEGEVRPEQGYQGEEVVSGALMRLTLEHDTKVVFVNPLPQRVLAEGQPMSTHRLAAQRLEQMNFKVREWQPEGGVGPDGQPAGPGPEPAAEPGQTMVYIALPIPAGHEPPGGLDESPAVRAVRDHINAGRPAMVFLNAKEPTQVGQSNPLVESLKEFGITADASRVAMHHTATAGGRVQGSTQIALTDWPSDHRLSRAVHGLHGLLLQAVHMQLEDDEEAGVSTWPIAQAPADAWAGADVFQVARARPQDGDPRGPFPVAAAAQRGHARLVAIGDPVFASDVVATHGPRDAFGRLRYARYPANQELFVNSVYWLAGLDHMIAPGARSQDVRRIAAISRPQMLAIGWSVLAGLPLACLLAGLGVWFVRRQ